MGSPRILFAGGGSGGHLMPGIAVAKELARRLPGCDIRFITSPRGIDSRVLGDSGLESFAIPMTPLLKRPTELLRFAASFATSLRLLRRVWRAHPPDIVIGLGGFTSVPVGLTARRNGTPLVLLEQNVIPGRATSLLAPLAKQVCISFEETTRHLRSNCNAVVTGNPVREEIARMARCSSKDANRNTRVLLVLGGSQGAAGLNSTVLSAAGRLRHQLRGWRIVHQTGERDAPRIRAAYRQLGVEADVAAYFDDLPQRYGDAQLVISRAGATTLAELACYGLPAILVPFPNSARHHQDANAEVVVHCGAACVVPECAGATVALTETLMALLDNPICQATMSAEMRQLARPDATTAVVEVVLRRLANSPDRARFTRRAA